MRLTGRRKSLYVGLAVALIVNALLIALLIWSREGQTAVVEVRNDGGAFRTFTDGKRVVPGGDDLRDAAALDGPERGTVVLLLPTPISTLPGPSGVDSIEVIGPAGDLLFRDDFDELGPDRWDVLSGAFEIEDGVLVATALGAENSVLLRHEGWSEYDVRVTYRNGRGGVIGVNVAGEGGVFYHFDLVRDFPNFINVTNRGESQPGAGGGLMRTDEIGPIRSTASMLARAYPYLLAGLMVGTLAVWGLSAGSGVVDAGTRVFRRSAALRMPWGYLGVGGIAVCAFSLTLLLNATYYSFLPHVPDEVSYLFQANLLADFQITDEIPPVREAFRFYNPPFLYENGDRWASVYPFGHPIVLGVGAFFGAANVVPSLVGAACVVLTFLVGRRLFGAWTGLVAAGLLATSPFFLMQSSNFMSHNTAALYVLGSLLFILKRDRPWLYGALAGLLFGLAVNTRTLTMVALVPPFGALMLAYLVTGKEDARTWLRHTAPFLGGVVVMLGALLLYNYAITGDPFTTGYAQTQGDSAETFGFSAGHTLDIGLRNLQAQLMALLLVFNAWPDWAALALVLAPFVLGTRDGRDYFLAACVLATVVLYVGYRFSGIYEGPRYWYETMPFLVLLAARGAAISAERMTVAAAWLHDRVRVGPWPRSWAGYAVVYATIGVLVVYGGGGWLFGWAEEQDTPLIPYQASAIEGLFGVDDRLDRLADGLELKNALVLVRPCGFFASPACYGSVFLRNQPNFDGEVVWALYDESFNDRTIAAFPGREVYVATWDPVASIVPLDAQ